ncbi:MAG: type I restriction enzyme endonuclease domain-containing protein [Verrucomicrobiales bacterium]
MLGKRDHLSTREKRLDALAKDTVHHFLNRGYQGKARPHHDGSSCQARSEGQNGGSESSGLRGAGEEVRGEQNEEEQRHVRENVSEEQLAIFDILTRPGLDLDPKEIESIKKVCKELLGKLKTELLVLAWRNKRTTRAAVRVEIEKMLDAGLPEKYTAELFEQKCGVIFQHVLEKYPDEGKSTNSEVG